MGFGGMYTTSFMPEALNTGSHSVETEAPSGLVKRSVRTIEIDKKRFECLGFFQVIPSLGFLSRSCFIVCKYCKTVPPSKSDCKKLSPS